MLCQGEGLRPYLEAALGAPVPVPAQFIGDVRDGVIVAAVGIANWSGEGAEIFLASAGGITRSLIRRVFSYIFDELGCTRCHALVKESLEWRHALPRLGFVVEGRMRRAFEGRDVVIYGMLKEECKYYGQ